MARSRRQFLRMVAAAAATGCLGGSALAAANSPGKCRIGLQLYILRGEFAKNVPETIKNVARLGYQGVEFWGYQGTPEVYSQYSAKQLRQLLDDHGLQCCGMHVELKGFEADQLQQTIENNQILGNRFLILASARAKMKTKESIGELAAMLNNLDDKCPARDMRIGYHAHPFDFALIDGRFAWEILFSQTRPEVIMQMDVANCLAGKGASLTWMKDWRSSKRTKRSPLFG